MKHVCVSIICNTYNHEKYIKSALEGFVKQKTNFDFEVLVHDDASTDSTPEIIREYELRYPDIIKPIYQKKNQHSQGIRINQVYQIPRVKGRYIAVCEGDDYWIDLNKLQKQYDAMEQYPQVDICAHSAACAQDGRIVKYISPSRKICIFELAEVIEGGGGFVATATLFYRTKMARDQWPAFRKVFPLDYTLQIHGSMRGGMLFLPENMAVYRMATESSWTVRMRNNKTVRTTHFCRVLQALEQLDIDTNYEYSNIIQKKIKRIQFDLDEWEQNYQKLLCKDYREIFNEKTIKKRLYVCIMAAVDRLHAK